LANLRALYAYMWAHPGKKLLFMGGEIAQWREWSDERSLDWHLLDDADGHLGVNTLVRDLNRILRERPALYELDVEPRGFHWIDVNDALENIVAFARTSKSGECVVCVCNFSAAPRAGYRFGLPSAGKYKLILNTDSSYYFGTDALRIESVEAEETPWHGLSYSAAVDLPPLTALYFEAPKPTNDGGARESTNESAAAEHVESGHAPAAETSSSTGPAARPSPNRADEATPSRTEAAARLGAKRTRKGSAKSASGRAEKPASKRAPRKKKTTE
jgi:1,4-alpha-glucan branching enzyme